MATRMQQRRGTAQQWTDANPVLSAGEIGFETDSSQIKIGDGTNTWSELPYFVNETGLGGSISGLATESYVDGAINSLIGGAPGTLDTLNELAAAIGDNPEIYSDLANLGTTVEGISTDLTTLFTSATANSDSIQTISGQFETLEEDLSGVSQDLISLTSAVNHLETGLPSKLDQGDLETINTSLASKAASLDVETSLELKANVESPTFTGSVSLPSTTSIGDVSQSEIFHLNGVTSAIQTQLNAKADDAEVSTTYAPLSGPTFTGTVVLPSTTSIGTVDSTELGHLNGVTSNVQTQLDAKAPIANPTFTGTVAGVTKAHVGLADVDNTKDVDKPVSLFQASAIANAKSEAIAEATSQVNAVIASAPAALNTLDELAAALGDDANFATTVTTSISTRAPIAAPTFTGLVTVASNGIAFTDGTQTKQGVPSITTIAQQTASYTLSNLNERDTILELNSASATTVTIPTDATVNYPIGTTLDIIQTNTGQVTVAGAGGVTVNATPGLKLRTRWSSATLLKRAANSWIVYGDLTA